MTDILVEMELRHSRDDREDFDAWWDGQGRVQYYGFKAEAERLEQQLRFAELYGDVETEALPAIRPRTGGHKKNTDPT